MSLFFSPISFLCAVLWLVQLGLGGVGIAIGAAMRSTRDRVITPMPVTAEINRATAASQVGLIQIFAAIVAVIVAGVLGIYPIPRHVSSWLPLATIFIVGHALPAALLFVVARRLRAEAARVTDTGGSQIPAGVPPPASDQTAAPADSSPPAQLPLGVEIHQLALLTGWAIYLHLFIALPQAWWIIMGFVVLVPLSMSRREARAFAAQLTEVAGVGTVARRQRLAYDESRSIDTAPLIGALDAITRRFSYPEKGWGVELLRHDVGVADEADAADAATESDETESSHDAEADAGAHAGGVSFRAIDRLREAGVPCHRHWRHWHDTWNLGAPTIPASLVRTLPYDTITAVVAMRACMIGGVPKATPYERPPRRISPIAMVVLLSSSVVGVAALSMISGRPSPFVVLIFVYAILPPMLLIFTQATRRSPGATGSHAESTIYYRKAHALWRDVARPDDASEAAMVLHLLTFERAMNPKAEADELMRAYFEKLHYRRLLGGAGSPIFAETRARAEKLLASPSLHQATIAEKASTGEEVRAGTPAPSGAGAGGGGAGHRPHRLNAR